MSEEVITVEMVVSAPSSEESGSALFLQNEPVKWVASPRYFKFPDMDQDPFSYSGIAIKIRENDVCAVTFMVHQKRRFYTHSRNRKIWTGPRPTITLFDEGDFPLGTAWTMSQVNRICGQRDSRVLEERQIPEAYMLVKRATLSFSSFSYTNC